MPSLNYAKFAIGLFLVLSVTFGCSGNSEKIEELEEFYEQHLYLLELSKELHIHALELRLAEKEYLLSSKEDALNKFELSYENLYMVLEEIVEQSNVFDFDAEREEIHRIVEEYLSLFEELYDVQGLIKLEIDRDKNTAELERITNQLDDKYAALLPNLQEITNEIVKSARKIEVVPYNELER